MDFSDSLSVLATLIIAFAACCTVLLTKKLVKAGTEPKVIAYITPHRNNNGGMQFILENVGAGIAKNISFKFEHDEEDFKAHGVGFSNSSERGKISALAKNGKIFALFGISFNLAGKECNGKALKPFDVIIEYQDSNDNCYKETFTIDISSYNDLPGYSDISEFNDIRKSLQKIANTCHKQSWQGVNIQNLRNISNSLDSIEKNSTKFLPTKSGKKNKKIL